MVPTGGDGIRSTGHPIGTPAFAFAVELAIASVLVVAAWLGYVRPATSFEVAGRPSIVALDGTPPGCTRIGRKNP
jgi:hypothetical protein